MKILGIIPARGGSKGVPGKNIKLLNGKPLLAYTTTVALQTKMLSKVIVSSEDDAILKTAQQLGVSVPFKRPLNLAEDQSPTLPVIQHALEYFAAQGEVFEAVCLLQPTSPFRTVAFLEAAIQQFIQQKTDSLVSVLEVPHEYNPHWTFEEDALGNLKIATGEQTIISRRQDLPKAFHRDGSIYITKTKVIQQENSLYGKSMSYITSPQEMYVNIDTLDDWKKAELMVKKNKCYLIR